MQQGAMSLRPQQQQQQQQQPHRHLVVGGHDIVEGRYPYFCSIDKNNGVIVNGALIAPDIVLSAGHIGLDFMDNLTLKVGPYAVHQNETFAETIPVEKWIMAPTWSQLENMYFTDDFLILKLEHSSTHRPVQINRDPTIPFPGQRVILTGLGWLNESFLSPADIVQEVELETISNQQCSSASDPTRGITYKGKIVDSVVCTVAPANTTRDGWYV
jgi:hypothetical protein